MRIRVLSDLGRNREMTMSRLLFPAVVVNDPAGLFHADDISVKIDDHLKTHHAHICTSGFRDARLKELLQLLIDILELMFDDRFEKDLPVPTCGRFPAEDVLDQ